MGARGAGTRDAREIPSVLLPHPPVCKRYQHADQVLGKRWVGLIVRMLLDGPCRFSEMASHLVVSDRTLSTRLGDLETHGIVERRVDPDTKPVRVEYALTDKGRALEPILRETARWADQWVPE